MNTVIEQMLSRYTCQSVNDYQNALKEIIQEIALLGLWRAKFFEHAAFYGGTALRLLYGLDRFSEDLDFSLLHKNLDFNWEPYLKEIKEELTSLGISAEVYNKVKTKTSTVESAFIKANTIINLITISVSDKWLKALPPNQNLKIKIEIDTDPPMDFKTENKLLLQPIPFSVKTFLQPDLFAGKIHALLCRKWQFRVKGRDWYDFVWYIGREIPVSAQHLKARLVQSGAWNPQDTLDKTTIIELIKKRIASVDFEQAKADVLPFVREPQALLLWSPEFFGAVLEKIAVI